MFARLGVFVGTFGLPAARAIGDDAASARSAPEPARVMETMGSLVDSSLVRTEPYDDEPRFSLLETVREYALDRLRDSGDWDACTTGTRPTSRRWPGQPNSSCAARASWTG